MTNSAETSITTILIFTDFSDASVNATNYAAALAMQIHASNLLICYSEHIPSTMEIHIQNIMHEEQVHQRYLAQLDAIKIELRGWVNRSIAIKTYIDQRPLEVIVTSLKKDRSVGLIVMGFAGKSAVEQALLGSNTLRVTKITSIPLLIIPESASFKTIKKIVFACDLKNVSKNTPMLEIKRIIDNLGAELSILNVSHDEGHLKSESIENLQNLRQLWPDDKPEYHYINSEDIVLGIMKFADENQVQLVIAVPKRYGFFEKLFHESLTKKLTYHIHLPLLLLKENS